MVKNIFNRLQNRLRAPKNDELPSQITKEAGDLLSGLEALGWIVSFARDGRLETGTSIWNASARAFGS
jgi:hypothetical protein